jgi:hypothetical protein
MYKRTELSKKVSVFNMSSEWKVVFASKVSGNEQDRLMVRVTTVTGGVKPTLFMDIREVANGRFTKTGVALSLQESQRLLEALRGTKNNGQDTSGGRRFSFKRTSKGMDVMVVKVDDSRQNLFLARPDLSLIQPIVAEAMGHMKAQAKELGIELM